MASDKFWANSTLEPKRQYRFILNLGGIEQWVVKSVNRPSFTINNAEHNYINHRFYYPGRIEWNTVSFTIVDPVDPDTTGILMKMLMASGYRFPTDKNGTRTISKAEAVAATGGQVFISMLGAGDAAEPTSNFSREIEKWTLHNPWVEEVSMGDLSYESDDLVEMEVTLRYDWASFESFTQGSTNTSNPALQNVPDGLFGPQG